MRTYRIYIKTIKDTYIYDPVFGITKGKGAFETGWMFYKEVKGGKELCKTLLNNRWRKMHYKSWCENHCVMDLNIDVEKYYIEGHENNVYLIIDDRDYAVDFSKIAKDLVQLPKSPTVYKYRYDPVPGINNQHWAFANYYRSFSKPRVEDVESIDEAKAYTRNYKIKDSYVPDTWDDIPRSTCHNNSWKRYRKRQNKKEYQSFRRLNKWILNREFDFDDCKEVEED